MGRARGSRRKSRNCEERNHSLRGDARTNQAKKKRKIAAHLIAEMKRHAPILEGLARDPRGERTIIRCSPRGCERNRIARANPTGWEAAP